MKITKTEYEDRIEYKNELGQYHREDGPAIEYISGPYKGSKFWYISGQCHRLDGPAAEYSNRYKSWYVQGKRIDCKTQKEFERLIKLAILW